MLAELSKGFMMAYTSIDMTTVSRKIRFPLPVSSIGEMVPSAKNRKLNKTYSDYISFCLRLSADKVHAIDYLNDKKYMTKYPHLIIKAPGVEHRYEIDDRRHSFFFAYSKELIPVLEEYGFMLKPYIYEFQLTSGITDIVNRLKTLFPKSRDYGCAEKIDILCFMLLEELTFAKSGTAGFETSNEKKIRAIASYLQLNFRQKIQLDDLIKKNGLSKRSFFRLWKSLYNDTPLQYILSLRLEEAKRLLVNTEKPISDIAEELHLTNSNYFIRIFKRKYNKTPLQYRLKEQ